MKKYINRFVVGHFRAKKMVELYVFQHMKRVAGALNTRKRNLHKTGLTGSGKKISLRLFLSASPCLIPLLTLV